MELIQMAEKSKVDILIHQIAKKVEWYHQLEKTQLKAVPVAHCYLSLEEADAILKCGQVKRVVFVGREEYEAYIDHEIINKSGYIYNMVNTDVTFERKKDVPPNVTYVGSLVPAKGFHILAKIWPLVLTKVPDAKLNVIGTGKLYDRNAELGKYALTEQGYEDKFMKYLTDKEGNILPSVTFLGILGAEKQDIFFNTSIGVVNPSAKSETFCISAVEMELAGIPIVTRGKWGLLDTVIHKKTGLLFSSKRKFKKYIIELLQNKEKNKEYGQNASDFVRNEFEAGKLIFQWQDLLNQVHNNVPAVYQGVRGHLSNDYKWLKIITRFMRLRLHQKWIPSVLEMKYRIKKKLRVK